MLHHSALTCSSSPSAHAPAGSPGGGSADASRRPATSSPTSRHRHGSSDTDALFSRPSSHSSAYVTRDDVDAVPEPFVPTGIASHEVDEEEQLLLCSQRAAAYAESLLLRQLAQDSEDDVCRVWCNNERRRRAACDRAAKRRMHQTTGSPAVRRGGHATRVNERTTDTDDERAYGVDDADIHAQGEDECDDDDDDEEEEEDEEFAQVMAQADAAMCAAADCLQHVRHTRTKGNEGNDDDDELAARLAALQNEDAQVQSSCYTDYLLHTDPLDATQPEESESAASTSDTTEETNMWSEARARAAELQQFLETLQAKDTEEMKTRTMTTASTKDEWMLPLVEQREEVMTRIETDREEGTAMATKAVTSPPQGREGEVVRALCGDYYALLDPMDEPPASRWSQSNDPADVSPCASATLARSELPVLYAYEACPSSEELAQLRAWDGVMAKRQDEHAKQKQQMREEEERWQRAETSYREHHGESDLALSCRRASVCAAAPTETNEPIYPSAHVTEATKPSTAVRPHMTVDHQVNGIKNEMEEEEKMTGGENSAQEDSDAGAVMREVVAELLPHMSRKMQEWMNMTSASSSSSNTSSLQAADNRHTSTASSGAGVPNELGRPHTAMSFAALSRHAARTHFRLSCEAQEGQAMRWAERVSVAGAALWDCLHEADTARAGIAAAEQQSWHALCLHVHTTRAASALWQRSCAAHEAIERAECAAREVMWLDCNKVVTEWAAREWAQAQAAAEPTPRHSRTPSPPLREGLADTAAAEEGCSWARCPHDSAICAAASSSLPCTTPNESTHEPSSAHAEQAEPTMANASCQTMDERHEHARCTVAYGLQHMWRRYARRRARYAAAARVIQSRWRGAVVRLRLQRARSRWAAEADDEDEGVFVKVDELSWAGEEGANGAEGGLLLSSHEVVGQSGGVRPLLQKVMAGRLPEPQLRVSASLPVQAEQERSNSGVKEEVHVPLACAARTNAMLPPPSSQAAEGEKEEHEGVREGGGATEGQPGAGEWRDYRAALAVRLAKKNRKMQQVHEQHIRDTFVNDPLQARRLRGTR